MDQTSIRDTGSTSPTPASPPASSPPATPERRYPAGVPPQDPTQPNVAWLDGEGVGYGEEMDRSAS